MNFGERKDPPHKGEKEVPVGASDCLAGLTFVISGTLDSLEREEAEDLIKRHGGRITGSVSKKTTYLLCDEDIGGKKSTKAKELGTKFLTEDGLFDMIRKSNKGKAPSKEESKKSLDKESPKKAELKSNSSAILSSMPPKISASSTKLKEQSSVHSSLMWTEKYKPKVPTEIIGNQFLVNQLRTWLAHWDEQFLHAGSKGKGKKQNDANSKKAVLLSGTPGIGKTTSAKVVCEMLGFQTVEVNASDTRGKADSQISKGIGGSNANSIKELVSNETIGYRMDQSKRKKSVLIMDEVDGMSAGVADLIASIKISRIPIICICNDRYSIKEKAMAKKAETGASVGDEAKILNEVLGNSRNGIMRGMGMGPTPSSVFGPFSAVESNAHATEKIERLQNQLAQQGNELETLKRQVAQLLGAQQTPQQGNLASSSHSSHRPAVSPNQATI